MSAVRQIAVAVNTTATLLTDIDGDPNAYDNGKVSFAFYNNGSTTFYIGGSDVIASSGIPVLPNAVISLEAPLGADLYGITNTGSTDVRIMQIG